MRLHLLKAGLPIAAMIAFTGCMDDKYDLDDLDTTTRIPITDLTVPVNLEDIVLDEVIDLSDNENIEDYTDKNGNRLYAISKKGELTSDDIVIDKIEAKAEDISSTSVTVNSVSATLPGVAATDVVYQVEAMESDFSYTAENIDDAVKSITAIESAEDIKYDVTINVPSSMTISKMTLHNVKIHFPTGMLMADGSAAKASVGTYDPATGDVTIDNHAVNSGSLTVTLTAERVDLVENGAGITDDRTFKFNGKLGVLKNGHIVLSPASGTTLASSFDLTADYGMTHFFVKNFDGEIDYLVEGIDIDPISFDDLPDFLKSGDTQIFLSNPQVYISAKNSTAPYGTEGSAAITLTSKFKNGSDRTANSEAFVIGYDLGPDVDYNIVLSPNGKQTDPINRYAANAHKFTFNGLGDILASKNGPDGLPDRIEISLENPRFFGNAKRFPVEVPGADPATYTIKGLHGDYDMFAPLAFNPETRIVYSKVDDGWESEDLDGLEIEHFSLHAHAVTTIDLNVILTIYPLDAEGNKMGRSVPLTLPANADEDIEIIVESEPGNPIKALGGIEYHAIVETPEGSQVASRPLGPDETINLTNIRVKVSGSYTKDF